VPSCAQVRIPSIVLALGLAGVPVSAAVAQTPPSAAEVAAYRDLFAIAATGDAEALRTARPARSELEARDSHGRTALLVAAHGGHQGIVRALAAAGADMRAKDSRNYDILTIAAVRDDVEMIKLAASLGADAKAITSPYDGTALIAAAHLGHAEVVAALIAAGAPLDHVNNLGWTAVIEAVILGDGGERHRRTLRILIEAGANTQIADRDGVTPLVHARRRGFSEMVRMLESAPR
jgi:uncharacterized protein